MSSGSFILPQLFSGATVTSFTVAGFVGSLVLAVLVIRTKALTSIIKCSFSLGVVCAVVMMEVSVSSRCGCSSHTTQGLMLVVHMS